jgi:predicted HTH domain antitoxin
MVVTLELPDKIAEALNDGNRRDLSRQALEALAVDGYRQGRLTQKQVGEMLELSRVAAEDFLAVHTVLYDFDPSELTSELEQLREFTAGRR